MIKNSFLKWIIAGLSPFFFGAIWSFITSIIQKISFVDSTLFILKKIMLFFKIIFLFKIPVWLILIFIAILIFIFILLLKIYSKNNKRKTKYKYKNWVMKWDYSYDKKRIINLRPICDCGCELSKKSKDQINFQSILYCPSCNKTYPTITQKILEDAEKVIVHHLNNGGLFEEVK